MEELKEILPNNMCEEIEHSVMMRIRSNNSYFDSYIPEFLL